MRWKLLAAFAGAFTLVFVFIAFWVVFDAAKTARARIEAQLVDAAEGAAATIDAPAFDELVTTVPAVPDPSNPTGFGYPDSEEFRLLAQQLFDLTKVLPEAQPYSYVADATDGQLYFAVSAGYYYTPQFGVTYKQPVVEVSGPATIERMQQGLTATTLEPAYTDSFGDWISAYTPIRNAAGEVVGAIGVDYPLDYVRQVQAESLNRILPILIGSYVMLMLLVLGVSGALVRPLRRLTTATHRIAEGEYDLNVKELVKSRFPDEIYELGESFEIMAGKVAAREQHLTAQVERLQVQIDASKRDSAVKEIVETDFFADLAAKAATLRARVHADDEAAPADKDITPAGDQAAPKRES
jgi:HAMP domain-containing protein